MVNFAPVSSASRFTYVRAAFGSSENFFAALIGRFQPGIFS
jgi:hypothetical protein